MSDHQRVAAAVQTLPRWAFLPAEMRAVADQHRPLAIGHGATNSQPSAVVTMLELLGVRSGDKVLDVGAGSGWTTALLATLTGPDGAVVGTEIVPELVDFGRANLPLHMTWAHIEQADPHILGVPRGKPFDRILVSADAGLIPSELEDQLAIGGRMVLPADGVLWTVERCAGGLHRSSVDDHRFAFVPLLHDHVTREQETKPQQPGSRAAR